MARCEKCGFRIRGKGHEQGEHHSRKRVVKPMRRMMGKGLKMEDIASKFPFPPHGGVAVKTRGKDKKQHGHPGGISNIEPSDSSKT